MVLSSNGSLHERSYQMQVYLSLDSQTISGMVKRIARKAPTFYEPPKIVSLNSGKMVQMIARYQASEKCYCTWSKKGMPVSESQTTKFFHEKINSSTYEYRIEINNALYELLPQLTQDLKFILPVSHFEAAINT